MTNEEAIEILQEEHNYVQEPCYVMNAIKKAIEALQASEKCDQNATEMRPDCDRPLTMEQLRQMDGKPVLYKRTNQWFIVQLNHPDFGDCIITQSGYFLPLETAAERGLYAYPPAHIDLEAWEPCEWCGSVGKKPDNWVCSLEDDNGHTVTNNHMVVCATANYCPVCGRPLTPEARAMLEKRLRG